MLRSTMHRVGLPPAKNDDTDKDRVIRSRYSIPYFVGPDADTVLDCLPACMDAEHPPKYEPITWNDYRLMRGKAHYLETAVA
jgi:isopenicillin N synthase-like dioxygenase